MNVANLPSNVSGLKAALADIGTRVETIEASGVGGAPAWSSVTDKPASFPPSAHTHASPKVTANVTNSTVTPTPITGLSFDVEADHEYGFHAVITHQGTATSGPRFGVSGPAGAVLVNIRWARSTTPTGLASSNDTAFSASAQTPAITSSGNTSVMSSECYGTIVTGANAGTVQFMLTSSTAGQTVTVFRGSSVHVR